MNYSRHPDDRPSSSRDGFFHNSHGGLTGAAKSTLVALAFASAAGVIGGASSVGYVNGKTVAIVTQLGVPQPGVRHGLSWKSPVPFLQSYEKWSTTRDNLDIGDRELSIRFADKIQDFCAFTIAYRVNGHATDKQLGKLYLDFHSDTDSMVRQKATQAILNYYQKVASYDVDPDTDRAHLETSIQERINADDYPFTIEEVTAKGCAGSTQNEEQKRQLSATRMDAKIIQQQIDNSGKAIELAQRWAQTSTAAYKAYKVDNVPDSIIPQLYCIEAAKSMKNEYAAFALAGCNGGGNGASIAVSSHMNAAKPAAAGPVAAIK